jgi:NAD(P)-dependent dehydrogenase (short-subunit alcohol dehydrogenase family)
MTEFVGRTAVVTGGGSGMGRELVRQLVAEACNVAMCDVSPTGLAETQRLCEAAGLPQGLRVTTHIADVADRTQVERFRDEVADRHQTDKIHLLFNNAGISGGGSMITNSSDEWERTFNICWGGVYNCTRAFLPMLQNAEEGHIVNTSSINGFWASVGPRIPHTAYSAAKFAVKGFTEALITDLRINAPHIKCSVVMPGQIGTSIRANTRKIHSGDRESDAIDAAGLAQARERFALLGRDVSQLSDDQLRNLVAELERRFRDEALTSAAQAATIILDGVKADRWRILVGADAHKIDEMVRQSPERAYDIAFFDEFARAAGWTERLSLENPLCCTDQQPGEVIPPRPLFMRGERIPAALARACGLARRQQWPPRSSAALWSVSAARHRSLACSGRYRPPPGHANCNQMPAASPSDRARRSAADAGRAWSARSLPLRLAPRSNAAAQ